MNDQLLAAIGLAARQVRRLPMWIKYWSSGPHGLLGLGSTSEISGMLRVRLNSE